MRRFLFALICCAASLAASAQTMPPAFIHPGINQTAKDLAYVKQLVQQGKQPYKDAYDKLKAMLDTSSFVPVPHTHVLRGPYGKPNIGGDDLSRAANMAYNYALAWYISNDKAYAQKAINAINAWTPVLWDLDYNDAKLLAAWTGHVWCNAAEILRYTPSGWSAKDISTFSNMLMTVYYPLLRPYYPEANGNWEGAIIHSLLAIGIFTDNHAVFDNAVKHFKYGAVNGSIFKYIYPNGECQESPRDQGHVQLGIGEFAGAAQVAYTQGLDFFSMADNRIGAGFEYTAKFLLGETPYCYCTISERAKNIQDDYEYVYRHYTAKGVSLPFVQRAADSARRKATRSVLVSVRAPGSIAQKPSAKSLLYPKVPIMGAAAGRNSAPPANAIVIEPGQSIQEQLDANAGSGKTIFFKAGIHKFPHTLKLPSNITLAGEGDGTVLFLDPASGEREAMINADSTLHDLTIRDLVIEVSSRTDPGTDPNTYRSFKGGYNRCGLLFRAQREGQMKHITLTHLTVRNATHCGLSVAGAAGITISGCNFDENGGNPPPGPKLNHNVLLEHCSNITVQDSRLTTSPNGSGISLDHCKGVTVTHCEIARNGYYGVLVAESAQVTLSNNLIEANDRSGILLEYLWEGNNDITVSHNRIQYNNGFAVESYAGKGIKSVQNNYEGNNSALPEKLSAEKHTLIP